jgi:predicted metal-dependent hydrolase
MTTADPRFAEGIALFNAGRYFDAHEVWEHVWRGCPAADRRFVQSLIQAAVALYQWERGNAVGARTQLERGRSKAADYPPQHLGIDLARLWREVASVLDAPPPSVTRPYLPHDRSRDE